MKPKLKPINEQVIVLTGASSGIGLVTARLAARQGAKLVLAARSEDALRALTTELVESGAEAIYVVTDVRHPADLTRLAEEAIARFGGFDTWINNAGVSMYGKLEEQPVDDMRKLFETNFWSVVHGSLEAARHLKGKGGAIINTGSILSEVTAILQSIYSASKHAVKGFTDGLRQELEMEGAGIAVTLIKPAAIDTPYTINAKNYMDREPKHAPPAYAPDTVARAIVHCCATYVPEITVGGGGRAFIGMQHWTPRLLDSFMKNVFVKQEQTDQPPHGQRQNGLDTARGRLQERGNYPGMVRETSLYTTARLHPATTAAVVGAGIALVAALSRARR